MSTNPQKIEQLEALAREMVGDGGTPNLFFVSISGVIVLISRDGSTAHEYWRALVQSSCRFMSCMLEDRKNGVLCSREPADDNGGNRWITTDDFEQFIK